MRDDYDPISYKPEDLFGAPNENIIIAAAQQRDAMKTEGVASNLDKPGVNPKDLIGTKKPPLNLFPPAALIHGSLAMGNGAVKYGPYNWRKNNVIASIYVAAAMRHIASWYDGEQNAADSGVHHLGHAIASLAILLDAEATNNLVDDRPVPGAAATLIDALTKG